MKNQKALLSILLSVFLSSVVVSQGQSMGGNAGESAVFIGNKTITGNLTVTGVTTLSGDVLIDGTTPTLTIGDGDEENIKVVFDGVVDFWIGTDDGNDEFGLGVGSTPGTTPMIRIIDTANIELGTDSVDTIVTLKGAQSDGVFRVDGFNGVDIGSLGGVPLRLIAGGATRVNISNGGDVDMFKNLKVTFGLTINSGGNESLTVVSGVGAGFQSPANTFTDGGATDPIALAVSSFFGIPTFSDADKLYVEGANLVIEGPAAVTGGASMTRPYSLLVLTGDTNLGGDLLLSNAAEGRVGNLAYRTTTDLVTMTGSQVSTTTIDIPTGAEIKGCSFNVNTAVVTSGATNTWDADFVGGSTTNIVAAGAAGAEDTKAGSLIVSELASSETNVEFDAPAAETFSSGVIEVVCYYVDLTDMDDV